MYGPGGYGPPPGGYGPPPGHGYGMYPVPPSAPVGPTCQACGQQTQMVPYEKTSAVGWVILILGLCLFPLNLLGLLFKERGLICQRCKWRHRS